MTASTNSQHTAAAAETRTVAGSDICLRRRIALCCVSAAAAARIPHQRIAFHRALDSPFTPDRVSHAAASRRLPSAAAADRGTYSESSRGTGLVPRLVTVFFFFFVFIVFDFFPPR